MMEPPSRRTSSLSLETQLAIQESYLSRHIIPTTTKSLPRKKRNPKKVIKDQLTLSELKEAWQFVFDEEDILEDYLTPQKLKDLRPLILDRSQGEWTEVPEISHLGTILSTGKNVRLRNGTFLRIHRVLLEFDDDDIVLRGHKLVRTARLRPILDDDGEVDNHELFLDMQYIKGCDLSIIEQALIDIPIDEVEEEVSIHYTNCHKPPVSESIDFFCRWKLTRCYEKTKRERRAIELAIQKLRAEETDPDHCIPDDTLRFSWRGETTPGGSADGHYTALDGFCCAGGWSRGTTSAGGIKVVRSFDVDPKACGSYRMNFLETNCLNLDVFDYCLPARLDETTRTLSTTPEHVDIAHYSTPCQFFSPAHTIAGPKDEQNYAASYCLLNLLQKDKPRIVTFENTAGLERRHFAALKRIFGQVTSMGYSIRFATLNLANYGLPQNRKRLIMLASCPGEALPSFPPATHSQGGEVPGTLAWTTLLESIARIPWDGCQNHNPQAMKKKTVPSNAKAQAATITCAGGIEQIHPDGRQFTLLEIQTLQGFPLHHRWMKGLRRTLIRRQIGNAFPATVVKQLMRHIRQQLQKADGIPIPVDADFGLTDSEVVEKELAQFIDDHHKLPVGMRANMGWMEPAEIKKELKIEDEEDDEPIIIDDDDQQDWSWVTAANNQRRASNISTISASSSEESAFFPRAPKLRNDSTGSSDSDRPLLHSKKDMNPPQQIKKRSYYDLLGDDDDIQLITSRNKRRSPDLSTSMTSSGQGSITAAQSANPRRSSIAKRSSGLLSPATPNISSKTINLSPSPSPAPQTSFDTIGNFRRLSISPEKQQRPRTPGSQTPLNAYVVHDQQHELPSIPKLEFKRKALQTPPTTPRTPRSDCQGCSKDNPIEL